MNGLSEAPVPQVPAWSTVREMAELLRLPDSTAYDLVRRGEVPSRRFGRHLRVPRAWLDGLAGDAMTRWSEAQGATPAATNLLGIPRRARPAVRGR